MKLFFDTEFTGLHKNTTLISIGIVSEDGRKFYAELRDYSKGQCDEWIKENVLKHTMMNGNQKLFDKFLTDNSIQGMIGYSLKVCDCLCDWLNQFDSIQFVSDVCHYDFVLLIDLITSHCTAMNLPENISSSCHDINQDIAAFYGIEEREAFNLSREVVMKNMYGEDFSIEGLKHNALYDAEVIRVIYLGIQESL